MHTHTQRLFPASQPPRWDPYIQESSRFFHCQSLGYRNQRAKWMFSSENWHWTEGRKRLLQFKHVLISGEVGTGEGQNWLKNQWESHQFCLLSQQLGFFLYCAAHSFLFFQRVWIMNNHFLNSQVQKSLGGGRAGRFGVNLQRLEESFLSTLRDFKIHTHLRNILPSTKPKDLALKQVNNFSLLLFGTFNTLKGQHVFLISF